MASETTGIRVTGTGTRTDVTVVSPGKKSALFEQLHIAAYVAVKSENVLACFRTAKLNPEWHGYGIGRDLQRISSFEHVWTQSNGKLILLPYEVITHVVSFVRV